MKIVQAKSSVMALGSHNYLVLIGDNGQVVQQLHGFQSKDGVPSTTGVGGQLQVFSDWGYADFSSTTAQQVLYEGSSEAVTQLWQAALDCGYAINSMNYDYNITSSFGAFNSNAALNTMLECIYLDPIDLGGFNWGLDDIILSEDTMNAVRAMNDIDDIYIENPEFNIPEPTPVALIGMPELA